VEEEEDAGAGDAFEDRDCWGVREVEGRDLAHAPLCSVLDVFLVFALVMPHTVVRLP